MHVEGAQRDMHSGKVWMHHLPHALRSTEILQSVRAEVGKVHAIWHLVDDQPRGRVRDEDLVTVPDGAQSSTADHGLTEVIAFVAQLRFTGVDRHAHVELGAERPFLGHERSLGVDRRGHSIGRPGKGGDHAVALPLLDRPHTTVARQ